MSRLRVLQSFSAPAEDDNPFIALTVASLEDAVEVRSFTWRAALFGRYDVVHLHWLDPFVYGPTRLIALLHWAGSLILVARLRLTGTPVVRTLHNKSVRGGAGRRLVRLIINQLESLTVITLAMNRQSTHSRGHTHLVPHGHYRPWFDGYQVPSPVPDRLLTFGLLRAYKGLDALLDAFTTTTSRPEATLHVVGRLVDPEVGRSIELAVDRDARVISRPGHASDEDLATEIGESEIVVLPYDDLFNSGCVLLTLSLGRPVLVPECDAARELIDEFGPDWVFTFAPPLTSSDLCSALDAAASENRPRVVDLSRRNWDVVGASTVAAYEEAVAIARGRRNR